MSKRVGSLFAGAVALALFACLPATAQDRGTTGQGAGGTGTGDRGVGGGQGAAERATMNVFTGQVIRVDAFRHELVLGDVNTTVTGAGRPGFGTGAGPG